MKLLSGLSWGSKGRIKMLNEILVFSETYWKKQAQVKAGVN